MIVCIYVYLYTVTISACLYICTYVHMYVCIRICTCTYVYVDVHVCEYEYVNISVYIYGLCSIPPYFFAKAMNFDKFVTSDQTYKPTDSL